MAETTDYDAMEAGRELDALVAEKVFGWKWIRFRYELGGAQGPEEAIQVSPDDFPGYFDEDSYMADDGKYPRSYHPRGRPAYSTDIAAAWFVVERMRDDKSWERFVWNLPGALSGIHSMLEQLTPIAICRAALKVKLR